MTFALDLRPDQLEIVRAILRRHVPDCEVWAFGSRVTGTAKPYSDLDLAVIGDGRLSRNAVASLAEDFSESALPFKVDVVDWAATAEGFRKIIEHSHIVLPT